MDLNSQNSQKQTVSVDDLTIHPDWDLIQTRDACHQEGRNNLGSDLCVLNLKSPGLVINSSTENINTISLAKVLPISSNNCKVAGWGYTNVCAVHSLLKWSS